MNIRTKMNKQEYKEMMFNEVRRMKRCKHCKKDLTRNVEQQEGIYHMCRGMYFCDECWEYLIDNERKYIKTMEKLKLVGEVQE